MAQILARVTTGDSDFVEHDFYAIFTARSPKLRYEDRRCGSRAEMVRYAGCGGVVFTRGRITTKAPIQEA